MRSNDGVGGPALQVNGSESKLTDVQESRRDHVQGNLRVELLEAGNDKQRNEGVNYMETRLRGNETTSRRVEEW